ncbi:thiamine-binding protein [Peptoniphilus sp. KCTC 25270]|uniref:thiamine-binding protein n=1 Tax=Peptoniphilus sp. KCTC 25270 TaxID=2897414 RepID=UPI001E3202E3|nr:thiamine-binding protein [Peptoniphilus sp. KCTC 25270]MCD1146578.1 thiamine-binding protein [Peptoniphilus sp. KCTC 25270]
MNCALALQTLPQVDDTKELVRIVDEVIAYIESTGLEYFVGPFETTVEGDLDQIMDIIRKSQEIAIREGAPMVSSYVKLVYSPDQSILTTDEKVSKYHE